MYLPRQVRGPNGGTHITSPVLIYSMQLKRLLEADPILEKEAVLMGSTAALHEIRAKRSQGPSPEWPQSCEAFPSSPNGFYRLIGCSLSSRLGLVTL